MTDKEILEQVDKGVKESPSTSEWVKQDLVEELKKPTWNDIPLAYKSWESSSLSQWSHRDVEYVYWEWKDDIIWAVLVDYSYHPGGWCWMEYWVKLFVKRWKETDMRRIVYRDAYSSSRDDRWKCYTSIEWIEVKWDEVIVKVKSSSRTDTYTFRLKKMDKSDQWKEPLSQWAQLRFRMYVDRQKEELLDKETRHEWRYPVCYDLVTKQIPNMFSSQWVHPYDERPYDKAEIVDESIDLEWWTACIVIKTQIDANADSGKQFKWIKYLITWDWWIKLVESDQAYQSELMHWKRIDIRAQ